MNSSKEKINLTIKMKKNHSKVYNIQYNVS